MIPEIVGKVIESINDVSVDNYDDDYEFIFTDGSCVIVSSRGGQEGTSYLTYRYYPVREANE